MKLSVPRLAARRGASLNSGSQYIPPRDLLSLRTQSAQPSHQRNLPCTRRNITNATASKAHEAQSTPTNESAQSSRTNTSPKPSSTPSISEHVRLLMRRVPYPVAIITATDPSGAPDTSSFRGMTVSSFSTVTLTPNPVISFNVRRPSETLNALLASQRFLVHLLAPGSATATLARDFSKGNTTLASMLNGHGDFEFSALPVCPGEQDLGSKRPLPILQRRDGSNDLMEDGRNTDFPFVLECTLHPQKIDVQDHSIVLGTVVRAIEAEDIALSERKCAQESGNEHSAEHLCLSYANTKFWKMGTEI
ncbi:FMN-binding split barrel-like protein [Penicillium sp. IBT 35674x]|nr:FMN-binding split barrel-like protein [Penicillium sp. IBT 35674x]